MKTSRIIIILVSFGLCLFGKMCWAERCYVTDSFKITLRTGPSIQNKIVVMLQSGQPLDMIETKDDWTHVRVKNGKNNELEGWVMSRYLISRKPWEDQTVNLKRQNVQFKDKLARIEKEWRETGGREKEAIAGLRDTSRKFAVLQKKYEELKQGSANYVKLKDDYDSMNVILEAGKETIARLSKDNDILLASQRNRWLGIGALILLCGLLIGISMGRFQKKQRSGGLY